MPPRGSRVTSCEPAAAVPKGLGPFPHGPLSWRQLSHQAVCRLGPVCLVETGCSSRVLSHHRFCLCSKTSLTARVLPRGFGQDRLELPGCSGLLSPAALPSRRPLPGIRGLLVQTGWTFRMPLHRGSLPSRRPLAGFRDIRVGAAWSSLGAKQPPACHFTEGVCRLSCRAIASWLHRLPRGTLCHRLPASRV